MKHFCNFMIYIEGILCYRLYYESLLIAINYPWKVSISFSALSALINVGTFAVPVAI